MGAWNDPNGSLYPQDAYNFANEKALAENIVQLNSVVSWVYELPFGRGRKMMTSAAPLVNALLGDWQLDGIWNWCTGLPLTIASPACANCAMGGDRTTRANVVPGVSPSVANPNAQAWFNPAAFDQPPDFTMGNVSRTHPSLRGPSAQNWDLSVSKRVPIDSDRVVEFSAAAFNFVNHADWNPPDVTIGSASAPNLNAGKIIGSHGGRVIQVGLRFSF